MATELISKGVVQAYGSGNLVAYVRWAPSASATQTLTDNFGVKSVTRSGAGQYVVNLVDKAPGLIALAQEIENDTTTYHFVRVESTSASAGTVNVSHKSVVFSSVASGPTASDTVDEIEVFVWARGY